MVVHKSKSRKNNTKLYSKSTNTKITRKNINSLKQKRKKEMMSIISDLTEDFKKLKSSPTPSTPTAELVQSAKKINDEQTIYYNMNTNQFFILELQKRGQNYIITNKHRRIIDPPNYELFFIPSKELFPKEETILQVIPNSQIIPSDEGAQILWRRNSTNSPIYVNDAQPQF